MLSRAKFLSVAAVALSFVAFSPLAHAETAMTGAASVGVGSTVSGVVDTSKQVAKDKVTETKDAVKGKVTETKETVKDVKTDAKGKLTQGVLDPPPPAGAMTAPIAPTPGGGAVMVPPMAPPTISAPIPTGVAK